LASKSLRLCEPSRRIEEPIVFGSHGILAPSRFRLEVGRVDLRVPSADDTRRSFGLLPFEPRLLASQGVFLEAPDDCELFLQPRVWRGVCIDRRCRAI